MVAIIIISILVVMVTKGEDINWVSFGLLILGYGVCLFIRTPYKKDFPDYDIEDYEDFERDLNKSRERLKEGRVKTNTKPPSDTPRPKTKPSAQKLNDCAGETRPYINSRFINKKD